VTFTWQSTWRVTAGLSAMGPGSFSVALVNMLDAALGSEIEIPTVDGDFNLKIPAGTQPGDVIKAKGQGLPPRYGGKRGDMMVRVDVEVPRRLSHEQKEAPRILREAGKEKARK